MIKPKQKSLSTLVKELDTVFSLFIRLRDADHQGTIVCFVTGEKVWWKDSQAAHWIPRAKMPTRYHEQNVHACTIDSNQYDQNHDDEYDKAMFQRYGHGVKIDLLSLSNGLQKYTRGEIEDLINLYTDKVKELKRIKGL